MTGAGSRDRGSAAVELALLVPVLLAFLALIALTGRDYTAALAADALAHSAARAGSLHTDPATAQQAAAQAVAASVGTWGRACQDPAVHLHPATVAGAPAVRAEVTCTVHRDDLPDLGTGDTRTVTARAVSVTDLHREQAP
ncbi:MULTISPECIES: TadE/TadG family type IV pilus assembly protein [Nocardiopsidaceae]|uniref:Pilus assembly protein n=2 Tax=Nocardiopsidaceae TaxID=83676 RepID=A0ABY6YG27_9ACTN|nr:TadE/TadG family type IV pilus assembly protein [Streptomonospora nanhaiensis]WAE71198.1 pilus assembly protein [Streptomonospora nanhaiensis]